MYLLDGRDKALKTLKREKLTVDNLSRKNLQKVFTVVCSNCDLFFQVYLEESLGKAWALCLRENHTEEQIKQRVKIWPGLGAV